MEKKPRNWTSQYGENNAGTRLFLFILSVLGLKPAYFVLFFAAVQYALLDKKSKKAITEFRTRLGLKTSFLDYYRHFYSFGMSLVDRYAYLMSGKDLFSYTFKREDIISSQMARGKGVILLGAHMGNWEVAGNLLKQRLNAPINLLMYDVESEEAKKLSSKAVNNRDVNVIFITPDSSDSTIQVMNALRRGEIICMHGDRSLENQRSEEIEFLGKNALFPSGPFAIAAVTGASVVPFFSIKTGWSHYTFRAFDPLIIESASREERQSLIRAAMNKYIENLSSVAEDYPDQWYNFFSIWPPDHNEERITEPVLTPEM